MKNFLIKRITILISTAIFMSAFLVSFLEYLISDGIMPQLNHFQALVISMIIVIPFVAVLSYFVLMKIVKPIRNVISTGIAMIDGDFSVKADETLEGEIGLLNKTLNRLAVEFYRNVSQLYIEKNRLHQVLESLEEGMIAVDENRKITHYNQVFLEMFGVAEEDVLGVCVDDIPLLKDELNELSQAIEGKCSMLKNGVREELVMRIIIAAIEDDHMNPAGAVVLFRDITEHEKLEKMRKDYVANVSHELRSPLTSIRGLIEPLMDSIVTDEEDVKRYYNIIHQETMRLSRLVDDIMELSRLQTSQAVIKKSSLDLNDIIEMVYERYRMTDDDIQLIYKPISLPKVYSNYDRIEQILVILIDNAYKFTPKGGRIEIITDLREGDVIVRVRDNGQGIGKEDLDFVFDRFYKSDKSRTGKGTGLGLSIAREIMDVMGEEIKVASREGEGSEFSFTVALADG